MTFQIGKQPQPHLQVLAQPQPQWQRQAQRQAQPQLQVTPEIQKGSDKIPSPIAATDSFEFMQKLFLSSTSHQMGMFNA